MQYVKSIRALSVLGLLSLISVACVYDPVYYGHPGHTTVRPGYYAPWDYYYYPDVQVYFQYSTGFYFYYDTGVWVRTRILPPRFHLNPRARVQLHIESSKPYLYHRQHVQKYRSMPRYRTTPQLDRKERNYHRDRYEEYRHKSAPPVHTRPTPAPAPRREREDERLKHQPRPRYEAPRQQPPPAQRHEREEREQGTRFDAPVQHRPVPLVPGQLKQRHDAIQQSKPSRDGRQQPARRSDAQGGKVKQKSIKQPQDYDKQYKEQDQQQEGADKKRSKKDRREDERDKRYR